MTKLYTLALSRKLQRSRLPGKYFDSVIIQVNNLKRIVVFHTTAFVRVGTGCKTSRIFHSDQFLLVLQFLLLLYNYCSFIILLDKDLIFV